MRRRLLLTLLALSLLLGVANFALWAVSYWRVYEPGIHRTTWPALWTCRVNGLSARMLCGRWIVWRSDTSLQLASPDVIAHPEVRAQLEDLLRNKPSGLQPTFSSYTVSPAPVLSGSGSTMTASAWELDGLTTYGFGYHASTNRGRLSRLLLFPAWLPALLFLAPPLIYISVSLRRRSRRRAGRCPACGYDLRGSQPGAACPECGALTVPPALPHGHSASVK